MQSPKIKNGCELEKLQWELKAMTEVVDEILREYLTKLRLITKDFYEVKQETIIIRNGDNKNV